MDKKEKFLNKIPIQDKINILHAINSILVGDFVLLDIVKLKASDNTFRVRVGSYRIKFKKHEAFNEIIEINRRSDNTYKNLFVF